MGGVCKRSSERAGASWRARTAVEDYYGAALRTIAIQQKELLLLSHPLHAA
jgi:hypothetical protein